MGKLSCTVLGGCDARWSDGAAVALETRKAKALLVYLALASGKPQQRGKLAALFWDRSAEEQARASLRQTLSTLRKALGDSGSEMLVAESDTIWLKPSAVAVDALDFERLVDSGSPECLQQAVELYKGDFLAGFSLREESFEEWLGTERERLDAMALQALSQLLGLHEESGELERASQIGRRLLALDPLRESTHRSLMRLHWQAGNRSAALKQYETCLQTLRRELGVGPEAATVSLHQEILQHRGSGETAPPPEPVIQPKPASDPAAAQQIGFCTTADNVRLAFAITGSGPPLVRAANWLSHLEFDWQIPAGRAWLSALSERYSLVRYDERGCGLSDWDVDDLTFDAWVADLETVVDAAGLERFPLLGMSQGGAVAIAYAVKHPERVSHLILYGAYARGKFKRKLSTEATDQEKALIQMVKLGWGQETPAFRQVFASMFLPQATEEQHLAFNRLQRVSTSPGNAARFLEAFAEIDVQDLATQVQAPTLLMHASGDARVPVEEGRLLSALIPDTQFIELASDNHILLESEPAWPEFLSTLNEFTGTDADERCVLVVEDEAPIRELLIEALEMEGYKTYEADSGQAMREVLASRVPNVVLLDRNLPGEDGLSLAGYLREHYEVGIIMVTGFGEVGDRIEGLKGGADDYVAKPFNPMELTARVSSVMRRYSRAQRRR